MLCIFLFGILRLLYIQLFLVSNPFSSINDVVLFLISSDCSLFVSAGQRSPPEAETGGCLLGRGGGTGVLLQREDGDRDLQFPLQLRVHGEDVPSVRNRRQRDPSDPHDHTVTPGLTDRVHNQNQARVKTEQMEDADL